MLRAQALELVLVAQSPLPGTAANPPYNLTEDLLEATTVQAAAAEEDASPSHPLTQAVAQAVDLRAHLLAEALLVEMMVVMILATSRVRASLTPTARSQ